MIIKEALDKIEKIKGMLEGNNEDMDLKDLPIDSKTFTSKNLREIQKALFQLPQ